MSISGSGSGSGTGTPGGIPEYSLLSEQTAAASILRAAMGIVSNLDTVSFTQIKPQDLWKYETSSSTPTLHPLENLRSDVSDSDSDNSWKQILQDLVNDLPDDIKNAYQQSLQLSIDQRNASLVALGTLLEGTAKALSWMQNAVDTLDPKNPLAGPGSEIEARKILNMSLANTMMTGIINDSNTTFQSLRNEVLQIGSNDPHFDELTGILNQMGSAYASIINLNGPAGNTAEG